ncbi:MAG: hypothetical protein ACLFN5_05725 [bacterium]
MEQLLNWKNRQIRFTRERRRHIKENYPEMREQFIKIKETLKKPDIVKKSKTDDEVLLAYKHYPKTPVTEKYMCLVIKNDSDDSFVVTAYFTDSIKKGELIWKKKM